MIRAFIADDEPPARRKIARLLRGDPEVELAGEASSGPEAISQIHSLRPALVFLDIQMPGCDGLEVARNISLSPRPEIVFATAYDQHALAAFEANAIGYLLKPFDDERFFEVLARAKTQLASVTSPDRLSKLLASLQPQTPPSHLLVKDGGKVSLVPVAAIQWVEAARNYVVLHVEAGTHIARATLDQIAAKLDSRTFAQISRSHLVRLDAVSRLEPWFHGEYKVFLRDGAELRWTRRYLDRLPIRP